MAWCYYAECLKYALYVLCRYAECHYAECRGAAKESTNNCRLCFDDHTLTL
jgi:hypothetical protein